MRRYLTLLVIQLRVSALVMLQHRVDFVVDGLMGLFWSVAALLPLLVVYRQRATVAGWTWPEALVVLACFQLLRGVVDGAIQPALRDAVDHIRKGTLDFLIIKPVDAEFMVSTSRFALWRGGGDSLGGLALLGWAFHQLGRAPSVGGVVMAVVLLVGALAILHSLWIMVVSLAFFVMKVDQLSYLFASLYDFARWPASIFRGAVAVVFTVLIPVALITTFPALALLDRLSVSQALLALAAAVGFVVVARLTWRGAILRYSGASG